MPHGPIQKESYGANCIVYKIPPISILHMALELLQPYFQYSIVPFNLSISTRVQGADVPLHDSMQGTVSKEFSRKFIPKSVHMTVGGPCQQTSSSYRNLAASVEFNVGHIFASTH